MSGPVLFRTKQVGPKAMEGTRSPTKVQFTAYEQMFGFFNRRLFGGGLPARLGFACKPRQSEADHDVKGTACCPAKRGLKLACRTARTRRGSVCIAPLGARSARDAHVA